MNIFKWLIDLLIEDEKNNKNTFNEYTNAIFESANKLENKLYGTFSKDGFYFTFNTLLDISNFELIIFIKNFDSIFNDVLFNYFDLICNKFEKQLNKIEIYTFDGNPDSRFIELSEKYKCVQYQPLKLKDKGEAQNFIISDRKSYWLEESLTTMMRNSFDETDKFNFIKGCVNFNDVNRSFKLLKYLNEIKENIIKKHEK